MSYPRPSSGLLGRSAASRLLRGLNQPNRWHLGHRRHRACRRGDL